MTNGRLNVTIGADTTPLTAGINKAMASLRVFLTVGTFLSLAKQAVSLGSKISDLSARSQVGTKWFQELSYAATQTGATMEDLSSALIELRRNQSQALAGSANEMKAFEDLGVQLDELKSAGTESLFERIAESVRKSGGAIRETTAAINVLGRSGRAFIPAMVEGIGEFSRAANQMGLILSEDLLQRLDDTGDEFDMIATKVKVLSAIIVDFTWNVIKMSKFLTPVGVAFRTWESMQSGKSFTAALAKSISESGFGPMTDEMAREMVLMDEMRERRKRIAGASNFTPDEKLHEITGATRPGGGYVPVSDRFSRLGMFAGNVPSSILGSTVTQNKAMAKLDAIHKVLEKIANRKPGEVIDW